MSKHLPIESWKPSLQMTEASEEMIKERQNNLAILAGPGAGKTEILAQRASFLLQTRTCKAPQKILALCFKVDAASNIRKRVEKRCGRELAHRFISSTFDAFFISIVRRFSIFLPEWATIPPDFDVSSFDRNWWADYERLKRDGEPSNHKRTFDNPNSSFPLDLCQKPDEEMVAIWNYCADKKIAHYSMCRSMAFTIVKHNPQVRNLIKATYSHLFLDEFQDTTDPQYEFIKSIFKDTDTIVTAVGDTNQMIMQWAGANPKNFDKLKQDFNTKTLSLAVNHRSNSRIVRLINHVIKDLTPPEEKPIIYEGTRKNESPNNCMGAKNFRDSAMEAEYISKHINRLMKDDPNLATNDFVLILRQKAADYFNTAQPIFENNGLGLRNEDDLVVKDGIKIQDLMVEPLSIFWILLIRKKEAILDYAQATEIENIASSLAGLDTEYDRDYKKLKDYISCLVSCIDFSQPIKESIKEIINIIGVNRIKSVYPEYKSQHLDKVKKSFCHLFQDAFDNNSGNIKQAIETYDGSNQVKLMTIHKSKGLEFNTVFFVDFNTNSWWWLEKAVRENDEKKQQEEKNSFFVGLSRAEEQLFFTKNKGNWPPVIADLLKDSKLLVKMPDIE